jgi:hypothetical protein
MLDAAQRRGDAKDDSREARLLRGSGLHANYWCGESMAREISTWTLTARRALRRFGLKETPTVPQFDWCDHVCVEVAELDGYAVIHQRDPNSPFGFCVFEPSDIKADETVEVFERRMKGLDELPERVSEWRAFRQSTDSIDMASSSADHLKWLKAVAVDKKKTTESLNESRRHRQAGDLPRAWKAAGFVVKVSSRLGKDVPPLAKERLLYDLNSIAPDLLAWHLDRDDKGKLFLKRRVPLFRYDRNARKHQSYCLIVALPDKRGGQPELRAEWLEPDLQSVRFDAAPELFDLRVSADFPKTFFNADNTRLRTWSDPGSKSRAAFMATLRDQLAGRFEEAATRAGIDLDPSIMGCLRARRVTHMCTCCAPLDKQLKEWSAVLRRSLLAANLRHFATIMRRDLEQTQRWPRNEPVPILTFPMQRHNAKAHLSVIMTMSGNPRLCIHTSGSGTKVPVSVWHRPVDFDLLRAGLLTRDDLPVSVAQQYGFGAR